MFQAVSSGDDLHQIVAEQEALLVYYSHEECGVCKVLKPKIEELFKKSFPSIPLYDVDMIKLPQLAAQEGIFVAPTLVLYFHGQEHIRESRNLSLVQLEKKSTATVWYDI